VVAAALLLKFGKTSGMAVVRGLGEGHAVGARKRIPVANARFRADQVYLPENPWNDVPESIATRSRNYALTIYLWWQ
jgi:hypothetical protein